MSVIKNNNVRKLELVYKEYGATSPEFLEQVRGFILYLQLQYIGSVDTDVFHSCYAKLLEALTSYYNENANIGTFCFTVIRNQITTLLYRRKKYKKESFELSKNIQDKFSESHVYDDSEDDISYLNEGLSRIKLVFSGDQRLTVNNSTALHRVLLWEKKLWDRDPRTSTVLRLIHVHRHCS